MRPTSFHGRSLETPTRSYVSGVGSRHHAPNALSKGGGFGMQLQASHVWNVVA
jgi:hypothetical protein